MIKGPSNEAMQLANRMLANSDRDPREAVLAVHHASLGVRRSVNLYDVLEWVALNINTATANKIELEFTKP